MARHERLCPLILSLYGHPDAGGYWEKHCETHLGTVGFTPIPEWRSCFWHDELKLMLTVYVDDFKLSGPKENLAEGWRRIRSGITTDDPHPLGLYLGCYHEAVEKTLPNGVKIRGRCYNQE